MRDDAAFDDFSVSPCIPYAHKYAESVAANGMVKTLQKYSGGKLFSTGVRGIAAAVSGDFIEMMKLLVDFELQMLEGLRIGTVFLQNIVTDLLLGLHMNDLLQGFYEYVVTQLGYSAGFITMNFPLAVQVLSDELGLNPVSIASPVNKIGFRMNPSKEAVERKIAEGKVGAIAMSIFASGAIPAAGAIEYIQSLPGLTGAVFGASSRRNIQDTYDRFGRPGT
jgi:hypothetical protein